MPNLRKSTAAAQDLVEIWTHIAQDNPAAADRTWQRLHDRFQLLLQHPLMGESKEQYRRNLRSVVEGPYVIFYEPQDDGILVYRVLHGARHWQEMF